MMSLIEGLARAATLMADLGFPYAVIGGAAVVARARPRLTEDVDLLVAMAPDALLAAATRLGYSFEPADRPLFEEGLIRLTTSSGMSLGADSLFLEQIVRRAAPMEAGGPVFAQLEDLILLKLEAERPVDIDDVLALRDAAGYTQRPGTRPCRARPNTRAAAQR
jgi:hypothetical protein